MMGEDEWTLHWVRDIENTISTLAFKPLFILGEGPQSTELRTKLSHPARRGSFRLRA